MGLDITAYPHVILVGAEHKPTEEKFCEAEEDGRYHLFITETQATDWPLSIRGLEVGRCYVPGEGETFGFRAGSYGTYNVWRELLSVYALGVKPETVWRYPERYVDQPFFELVNFSDCEGMIGPAACVDLAQDFAEHPEVREKLLAEEPDGYYASKFDDWAKAFALAADTGLVDFH